MCAPLPKPFQQVMGPLHKVRLPGNDGESPFAFSNSVSVDFAGHWYTQHGRGRARHKRWIAVFACALSRAIHIEVVPSMDTPDCLLAFL